MANNASDCDLLQNLWSSLWNPDSGAFYLPNIIKNGLKYPILGIDLQPFATVPVPDLPLMSLFPWKALGFANLALTSNQLTGLDSIQKGPITCTTNNNQTDVSLTVKFGSVAFQGTYEVKAGGAVGCAMAAADKIIGGDPTLLAAEPDSSTDTDLKLATWFRDNQSQLSASDNGQVLLGMYYDHQDTIHALTTDPNNPSSSSFRGLLQDPATVALSDAVRQNTQAYQAAQNGGTGGTAPLTPIGSDDQYGQGFEVATYLGMAAQTAANGSTDPTNEYVAFLNSYGNFSNAVSWVQAQQPPVQSVQDIMGHVATAPPDVGTRNPEVALRHHKTREVIAVIRPKPLDREHFKRVWAARRPVVGDSTEFDVKGVFNDVVTNLTATIRCSFTSTNGVFTANVTGIELSVPALHISLENDPEWKQQPGLYEKVTNWIANTQAFQSILKGKLNDSLNSSQVLTSLSQSLNATLNKLGM